MSRCNVEKPGSMSRFSRGQSALECYLCVRCCLLNLRAVRTDVEQVVESVGGVAILVLRRSQTDIEIYVEKPTSMSRSFCGKCFCEARRCVCVCVCVGGDIGA